MYRRVCANCDYYEDRANGRWKGYTNFKYSGARGVTNDKRTKKVRARRDRLEMKNSQRGKNGRRF